MQKSWEPDVDDDPDVNEDSQSEDDGDDNLEEEDKDSILDLVDQHNDTNAPNIGESDEEQELSLNLENARVAEELRSDADDDNDGDIFNSARIQMNPDNKHIRTSHQRDKQVINNDNNNLSAVGCATGSMDESVVLNMVQSLKKDIL